MDILKVDLLLIQKISKHHFLRDFEKYFQEITSKGPEPHQFFSFWNISTNMVARGNQSFDQRAMAGRLIEQWPKFFVKFAQACNCWKFQADILIHIWFRAKRLKICCNSRPPLGNWCWCLPRGGLLLQQNFSQLAITQTRIKVSSWNFQHMFIMWLCKFDEKIDEVLGPYEWPLRWNFEHCG